MLNTANTATYISSAGIVVPTYEPTNSSDTSSLPYNQNGSNDLPNIVIHIENDKYKVVNLTKASEATEAIDAETEQALNSAIYGKILNKQ